MEEEEVPFPPACLIGTLTRAVTDPGVWPHLVRGDRELFGAVHHVSGPVLGPAQSLAALVQGLAGLLHGAGHAVRSRVQYAVTCRRRREGKVPVISTNLEFDPFGGGEGLTVAAKHVEPRTASLERAAGPQLSQIKAGSGDLMSTSRKAFQRCFPSNLPFSCPLLLLPPLLKWPTTKRGGGPAASAGPPHRASVDGRQSSSS